MHRAPRLGLFAAALLALASLTPRDVARAATLSLTADAANRTYASGSPVTLTLLGASMDAVDDSLFAALAIDPAALQNLQLQRFAPPSPDGVPWIQGASGCLADGSACTLIDMIHVNPVTSTGVPVGVDSSLEPFRYALLTGTAGTPGVYTFDFVTTPFTQRVDFFGLSSAPGITLTIGGAGAVVPEPGAALLFAAGVALVQLRLRRARAHL